MSKIQIKVISTGKYVPKKILTNQDLEKMVETSDEWITSRTGIKERRIAENETATDMAYFAAREALKNSNLDKDDIDLIIVASITGEQMTPSVANHVQKMLNIKQCMSFDVNAACTGYVYALEVASSLLQTGQYKNALVIGSEKLSNVLDYTDRNTCILFGDGAGATIIKKDENSKAYFYNQSKADETDALTVKKYIKMDGRKVFLFAVDVMKKSIEKILLDANLTMDDIDIIIPHQANLRIIQSVAKSLNLSLDKFEINLQNYGNTSAASIPIALDEYVKKHKQSKYVLLVGFGGGFTWGSAILQLN
jgi:3-oxoacyl-[acyl-carrier-protein] synthase-3